ncbi:hypothetical protein AB4037_26180 [Labrys sp. KB_33_2]|uniref:hypothetical protein n=1 Tax=unclassified Labrys (in: a-proteobacteria) TaxID=2688601 RepID=UPI003EB7332A
MNPHSSRQRLAWGLSGAVALSLLLAACGPRSGEAGRPDVSNQQPVVTADGTQQFPVPQAGRATLAHKLTQLVSGRIADARISNGWRTPAAAKAHPDEYAACVSADSGSGQQVFLIVTNGARTGDVISGSKAAERCADGNRVTQWATLPEAMGQS